MMKTRDPNTDELMTRALRGEAGAAESLLDRHRDRLRRMIAARLDRRIRSRVAPRTWCRRPSPRPRELPGYLRQPPLPFFAWRRQFARERLAKLHRHHIGDRRPSVAPEEGPAADLPNNSVATSTRRLAADGTSPSQGMIREEVRRGVRAALARLLAAGQPVEAIAHIERSVELQPDDPVALDAHAWSLVIYPNPSPRRAVEIAEGLVRKKSDCVQYLSRLGEALVRAGDWQRGREALESVVRGHGGDADDWLFLAMALWHQGEADPARRWYVKAAAVLDNAAIGRDPDLRALRSEVAALLGGAAPRPSGSPTPRP